MPCVPVERAPADLLKSASDIADPCAGAHSPRLRSWSALTSPCMFFRLRSKQLLATTGVNDRGSIDIQAAPGRARCDAMRVFTALTRGRVGRTAIGSPLPKTLLRIASAMARAGGDPGCKRPTRQSG
jgi:hypothetical protein